MTFYSGISEISALPLGMKGGFGELSKKEKGYTTTDFQDKGGSEVRDKYGLSCSYVLVILLGYESKVRT